ncbi:MAG TPA: glycoside hydrolase family 2 TIM barrel-domain containing protein, partial [Fimbriimonadaceae bacterium]|nr:glycoside hydrolase family 2 TIM barrel-domain containing protein [Fimbriimonadaceae bacterium]
VQFQIEAPMAWSPEYPVLYQLDLSIKRGGQVIDHCQSYFAFRKVELKDDKFGRRIYLNGRPLFMFGPLDQGWWPDGLYTAPTDAALRHDLQFTKALGFNMIRKHVKVEPERWYYWCDLLGILVWQDMPSGDKYIGGNDPDITRTPESGKDYETELTRLIEQKKFHPCIVTWVPYNEGWGQWDTPRIVETIKKLDPTRLVDNASGWTDRGVGDLIDIHRYPGPAVPNPDGKRAQVLGEFGGLGLPVEGHLWWDKRNWGYRTFKTIDDLRPAYQALIEQLDALRANGLSAAVYTQTTDVEGEVNGLMTYDRAVEKIDPEWAAPINERLYDAVPVTEPVVPTSEKAPQTWSYTTDAPPPDWYMPDFDDSGWKKGTGGFGQSTTPAPHVGTEWTSPDIWIRRKFTLSRIPFDPLLRLWHDEDAEVYINGELVASFKQWVDTYINVPFDSSPLRKGANTIAVHCKQTSGGQFIDVGIVERVSGS